MHNATLPHIMRKLSVSADYHYLSVQILCGTETELQKVFNTEENFKFSILPQNNVNSGFSNRKICKVCHSKLAYLAIDLVVDCMVSSTASHIKPSSLAEIYRRQSMLFSICF